MRWFNITWVILLAACAQARKVTFEAKPPDSMITIDKQPARPAGFAESIKFKNVKDVHTVTASHPGYEDATTTLTRDDLRTTVYLKLQQGSKTGLAIQTMALCTKVDAFGEYEPLPTTRFSAKRENKFIVYTEIANFQPVLDAEKMWTTTLKEEMTLYTETGKPVWPAKSNAESYTDKAHTQRHDFYLGRIITLPADLAAGNYTLKVTVSDDSTGDMAERSVPLMIAAQ